jgi:hypothetical protein
MTTKKTFAVGDRVQLTGKFLRSTGQYTGREGSSVWTITGLCNGDRWAITDQPAEHPAGYYSDAELTEDPTLAFRRIAVANLQHVK